MNGIYIMCGESYLYLLDFVPSYCSTNYLRNLRNPTWLPKWLPNQENDYISLDV